MSHRTVIGVHLLLFDDKRVLLGAGKNSGWCDGWWHTPVGQLEAGESACAAMVREAREELGFTIAPDQLDLAHTVHDPGPEDHAGGLQLCTLLQGQGLQRGAGRVRASVVADQGADCAAGGIHRHGADRLRQRRDAGGVGWRP